MCVCLNMVTESAVSYNYLTHFPGRRGWRGTPSKVPCTLGKRTCFACVWAPSWAAGGALTFVHLSSHFVLRRSSVRGVAGAETLPLTDHITFFVCHSFGVTYMAPNSCHPRFHHHHQHHLSMICPLGVVLSVFLRISTCRTKNSVCVRARVCVCVWVCGCGGVGVWGCGCRCGCGVTDAATQDHLDQKHVCMYVYIYIDTHITHPSTRFTLI